ncbi:MAG: hypothetical protein R3C14_40100 [Caldilineaceae bacterium]
MLNRKVMFVTLVLLSALFFAGCTAVPTVKDLFYGQAHSSSALACAKC